MPKTVGYSWNLEDLPVETVWTGFARNNILQCCVRMIFQNFTLLTVRSFGGKLPDENSAKVAKTEGDKEVR